MSPMVTGLTSSPGAFLKLWCRLFLICLALTAIQALPSVWSGNEVNYFDLAYRLVNPEAFGDQHAAFDGSNARIVSFAIIGGMIDLVGFETAKHVLTVVTWIGLSAALATLAVAIGLGLLETALALAVFVTTQQSLLGGEWILGTVEAKSFAYIAVIFGLAMAFAGRWRSAVVLMAAATYFHFLVGGFWVLAVILLNLLQVRRIRDASMMLGGFVALILPILALLVFERFVGEVDVSGLDRSLGEIYAVLRTPHHVAPFADLGDFILSWAPGMIAHAGFAVAFVVLRGMAVEAPSRLATWLAFLNGYILLASVLAFLDRDTHVLAPLYMFRPASLILLLSMLGLARFLLSSVNEAHRHRMNVVGLIVVFSLLAPTIALSIARFAFLSKPLEAQMQPSERALVDWIEENTPETASILLDPQGNALFYDGDPRLFAGMERLSGRGVIVNFKFVPTDRADLVRWYRLLQARTALFEGDCSALDVLNPDYVVAAAPASVEAVRPCGTFVDRVGDYAIFETKG